MVTIVEEINKRVLAKLIIGDVGNEGTADTSKEQSLRSTLQHAITFLDTENKNVWRDAELEIVDKSGKFYRIQSGSAGYKFTQFYDGDDQVQFVCRSRPPNNIFSWIWNKITSLL